jgi:hypothetical protein
MGEKGRVHVGGEPRPRGTGSARKARTERRDSSASSTLAAFEPAARGNAPLLGSCIGTLPQPRGDFYLPTFARTLQRCDSGSSFLTTETPIT